jgi:protein gp37
MGVSVEDQKTADERIPLLLQTPAAIRWVSYEPALGPVDFTNLCSPNFTNAFGHSFGLPNLDWIVCGGESGPNARPMHPSWARAVRDQCVAAGVAFHFKQVGEWGWSYGKPTGTPGRFAIVPERGGHAVEVSEYPRHFDSFGSAVLEWVGKRAAGRALDGREWNQFPIL